MQAEIIPIDKEILIAACSDVCLCEQTDVQQSIEVIITKLCFMLSISAPEKEQGKLLCAWIKKNYRTYTPDEIQLAFELNFKGEYPEKIECYGQITIDYFSSMMNTYQVRKAKAWAEYNRKKPSEEKQIELPVNRLEGLKAFIKTNGHLPSTWDWSAVFQQMKDEKLLEDYETMKKWMVPVEQEIKSGVTKLLMTSSNIIERAKLEAQITPDAVKTELRKRYVQKRIKEI